MDKFLEYIEDKKFVKWVLNPDYELETYWENYLNKNPSEKKEIELARMLIFQIKSKDDSNSEAEQIKIFKGIVEKLEKRNKRLTINKVGLILLKYASVAIIFFSLGIAYIYEKPSQFLEMSKQIALDNHNSNSQLILGNGKKMIISKKKSEIEYKGNSSIVINKQDTVQVVPNNHKIEINQLIVPYGKNSSIKLPDGTIAYLNAGSRLMYPSSFEGKKREVFLYGEGYFEVTHNAKMPFVVNTKVIEIEVLGTKFNISAYPSDKTIETVLVEGSVKIKRNGFHIIKNEYVLKPNQQATYYYESEKTEIKQVNVMNYVTWHEGYLNFESTDLSRIIKKLERYYNIKIHLNDPMMGVRIISGKLELNEQVDNVLLVLSKTASAELIKLNQTTYELK